MAQRLGEFVRGLEPVGRHLGERPHHDSLELRRDGRPDNGQRRHLSHRMARDDRVRRPATKRRLAGQHLVQDAPQAVDIGPAVEIAVRHALLGAHVVWRAERDARLRQLFLARRGRRPGDPEIHHQCMPVIDQDVLGLDVAVHDALLVRILERVGRLGGEQHRVIDAERPRSVEARPQRLAPDERHDVVQLPVVFPGVV